MNKLLVSIPALAHKEAIVCTIGNGVGALSIVRGLGRAGIRVHVIVFGTNNLAIRSRYCVSNLSITSMETDVFYKTICAIAKRCDGKPVLYVDNDQMLNVLMSIYDSLVNEVVLTCIPKDFLRFIDKKNQLVVAAQAGLNVPASWYPRSWNEFDDMQVETTTRLIAKMRNPVVDDRDIFKVLSDSDGKTLRTKLSNYNLKPEELVIQEFIEGGDDSVYFALCYKPIHSDKSVIVTGRKLVQSGRGDGGIMVLGEIQRNETVYNLTEKLINYLGYQGYFGIEFKYCSKRKEYFFIEVNLRPERINALSRLAGIELDVICFFDSNGLKVEHLYKNSPLSTGVWIDGRKLWEALRRQKKLSIFVYFFKILFKKKICAIWELDDMAPFLYSFLKH